MNFVDVEPTLENYWRAIILFGKNTNLEHETNVILSTFTDEQIELGCDTLKKLAVFIKSIN